jgi:hypothetical protein
MAFDSPLIVNILQNKKGPVKAPWTNQSRLETACVVDTFGIVLRRYRIIAALYFIGNTDVILLGNVVA